MPQNWVEMNGVKVNIEIADYLKSHNFFLIMRAEEDEAFTISPKKMAKSEIEKRGDPWIANLPKKCPLCGR